MREQHMPPREQALFILDQLRLHIDTAARQLRALGYKNAAGNLEAYTDEKDSLHYHDPYEWKPVIAMIKDMEKGEQK